MSRSRKKTPIIKYAPSSRKRSLRVVKRAANKRVRSAEDIPDGSYYKKLYCSWDIHDCIFYEPDMPESYRK